MLHMETPSAIYTVKTCSSISLPDDNILKLKLHGQTYRLIKHQKAGRCNHTTP